MRKDKLGISPVIAVILMVAITVVLAAVLYSMVANLTVVPSKVTPFVELIAETENSTTEKVMFTQPSTEIVWDDLWIFLQLDGSSERIKFTPNSEDDCFTFTTTQTTNWTITVMDNAGVGCFKLIAQGDYLLVGNLDRVRHRIQIFHTPTESIIADKTFMK